MLVCMLILKVASHDYGTMYIYKLKFWDTEYIIYDNTMVVNLDLNVSFTTLSSFEYHNNDYQTHNRNWMKGVNSL